MEKPHIINDHDKIEDVYIKSEEYFKKNAKLQQVVATHLWAYNEIGSLVPQTIENLFSGHFFPFAESYFEIENSFELCKQGFYRYSFFALRSVLELGIMGIYFDKDDQAHIDVQKWFRSEDPTPYFRRSLKSIFESDYFRQFNVKFQLLQKIEDIYSLLSDYVHTRGFRYSTTGQARANFNQFNKHTLSEYVDSMKKVVENVVIMMLLKYPIGMQDLPLWEKFGFNPPSGGFLDESSRQAVVIILNDESKNFLKTVSDNDPTVNDIVKQIFAMPDLTEEQIEKQRSQFNEYMEQHIMKEKPVEN